MIELIEADTDKRRDTDGQADKQTDRGKTRGKYISRQRETRSKRQTCRYRLMAQSEGSRSTEIERNQINRV